MKKNKVIKITQKCKRERCGGFGRVWLPCNGINNNNLITVVTTDSNICEEKLSYQSEKIKISLSNAQSLRRNDLAVENHICCHAIDAVVISETWLLSKFKWIAYQYN